MGTRRPVRPVEFPGHVGAALAAYSPIAFVSIVASSPRMAIAGAAVTIALASLPDVDHHVPGVAHRGYSHSVWFAAVVGAVCAVAFVAGGPALLGLPSARIGTLHLGAFGFAVGTVAVLSHIAADALTPMGVAPLSPLVRRRYSLGVTRSTSPVANRLLLVLGLGTAAATAVLGTVLTLPSG